MIKRIVKKATKFIGGGNFGPHIEQSKEVIMLTEYKKKTNIGVGVGIVLQIVGRILMRDGSPIGALVALIGLVFFIYGCFSYAQAKGQSKWFGLLGLLSIIGLLILFFLPDKHK